MEHKVAGTALEVVQGDITSQEGFDAVVNAANAQLRTGGGVAGAIHRAAGPGLEKECRPLAPIKPGEAVITSGHNLPNKHIIHCLGPVYGVDEPSEDLLASCYKRALKLAEENNLESIVFPALSTGAFGYPVEKAARVAFKTIMDLAPRLKSVKRIRFVLHGEKSFLVHQETLSKLTE
ncbi:MAG: macro domain-containing protein [Candidatus Syntrophonatronum acetioxidans]|uniref:Macro domain-containing protein n=1 Tax=Candidatus Syntrophonatronum acetioxidans TaxID=1795816 RepID=A0A424YGH8_9FIRM|nr:MAG: macro domain-containing protein [Candidatus Syntrophonatronum acetioxidans]